jgi:ribosomal protein L40E
MNRKQKKVAKKIGKFLENKGWEVFNDDKVCLNCGHSEWNGTFCKKCGTKLVEPKTNINTLEVLWEAYCEGKKEEAKA